MRTAIGILAICGMIGLAITVGTAQDRFTEEDPFSVGKPAPGPAAPKKTIEYFSRTAPPSAIESPAEPSLSRDGNSPFRTPSDAAEPPSPAAESFEIRPASNPPRNEPPPEVPAFPALAGDSTDDGPDSDPAATADLAGMALSARTFSPGPSRADSQAPLVTLRWVKHGDINVGQECKCDLVVKNAGGVAAREVAVEASFPESVRLTTAEPMPSERDRLVWNFEQLAPGEEKTIGISMVPSQAGELAPTAQVRFTAVASGLFHVEEPMLKLAITGPTEVMVGDPASQIILVSNPGTGIADNIVVEAMIPEGLEHPRGSRLAMKIGSLGPGESRNVRLALAAMKGGKHTVQVLATSDATLKQAAASEIQVIAPSVAVGIDGPTLRYLGRNATYVLTATNDGAADSNNVRILHKVPDGFKFLKADKGGQYDHEKGTISWFVGRLEAGQSIQVRSELATSGLGKHVHLAGAVSDHGTKSEAQFATTIDGTASLMLEIIDLNDPVEVGLETAYEIRVRNEGTKDAGNVSLLCELPAGVELIAAKGPTHAVTEEGRVIYKALDSLAPGETVQYRLQVRGTSAGNHRLRARLASDSIQEPLTYDELTKFYVD